jgi:hypothetical protein
MSLNRQQQLSKALAGTVSFPPTLPQLARLSISQVAPPVYGAAAVHQLRIEQRSSPTLTMIRYVDLADVRAVFLPQDPANVHFELGTWLMGEEIPAHIVTRQNHGHAVLGIVRVPEQAPVFTQVEVGLTAAESAEYYPPLSCDRSINHYQFPQGVRPVKTEVAPAQPCECESWSSPAPIFCECESLS